MYLGINSSSSALKMWPGFWYKIKAGAQRGWECNKKKYSNKNHERVYGWKMVYWKLNLGCPSGFLETWIGMGRIRLYSYDDDSCCLDFVSGVMILDIQSCSEEASLHLSCFRRDRWVMKHRYGPSPGHLSGAFAFESQTWVPTMTTIIKRHCFWRSRSWYLLLCQVAEGL